MSLHPRVVHKRRATITDLPLYYSGHLLKKSTKEKDFKKYYGELRGATLFLYKDDTQDTYTEKLDLEQLTSMELDSPFQRKSPTIFTLTLHTEEMQLKMDNPDTGEEWRGYILTVIKKEIPSKLQLLPGQMLLLQEVLLQEKRRNPPTPQPPLPPRPSFLLSASYSSSSSSPPPPKEGPDHTATEIPACFFNVSRQEAERMLEANPECGGIILRPSTLTNNYALTLRQLTPSGPVMKNYRVTSTNSGFVIELDIAVMVSSLNNVLKYFLEKTEYRLRPYMASQPYDTRIDVSPAPKCISINSPAPKTVPKAQVAPMLRSQTKEELLPPPAKPEEGEYVVPDDPDDQNLKQVQLDGELREVLKLQRETICTATDNEEVTYENQTTEKSHSSMVLWTASV
ncbi:signal-transducing adaptor protein 1-like [Enoplosus armatus]|uniref:signal-transducing adaptor protein 1-like n=1 Tax=Enoplosus armatus TaxID=215367 RepID=UPI003991567C